ncbi:MAG: methyltransferase regulatory domain-containing protein, partial [Verrucomicrobia bacterium]|nr:methyltransferase regulatory domain-containing protein [Verrucomicrobiota bacterium]
MDEGTSHLTSPYDEVLYPSKTLPQTHPSRLATVAFLRGMQPAPIGRCRVLELGCGTAANLIPMAFHHPESEFVGLDSAERPIALGRSIISDLGLRNITLHLMDLREAKPEQLSYFDYIIAHGVYSWVPQPVRERLLAISRELLNPQGVAYVSYNAYPGNHFRDLVRGMMRFHISAFETPSDKIGQARGLLKFLSDSKTKSDYYLDVIRAELHRLLKYSDTGFFHDDLNEINQPFYFHEFIGDARRHRLQFVGEAGPNDLNLAELSPEVSSKMHALENGDEIVREQFKDFIRGTAFRQTLLCRAELELAPRLLGDRVRRLYTRCDAVQVATTENEGPLKAVFQQASGVKVEIVHPLIASAVSYICSQYPRSVSFDELLQTTRSMNGSRSGTDDQSDEAATMEGALAQLFQQGFLLLSICPAKVVNRVSERPAASTLARFQLKNGQPATNSLHMSFHFPDPFARQLLLLLDGTRDRQTLARDLLAFSKAKEGAIFETG